MGYCAGGWPSLRPTATRTAWPSRPRCGRRWACAASRPPALSPRRAQGRQWSPARRAGCGTAPSTRRPRSPTPVLARRRGRARPRLPRTSRAGRVSSLRRPRRDRCRGPARRRRRPPGPGPQPRPSAIRVPGCSRRRRTGRARAGWSPRHPPVLRTSRPSSHPSTRRTSRTSRRRASRPTRPRAARSAGVRPGRPAAGPEGDRGGSRCGGRAGPSWWAAWRWWARPSGCSPRCTAAGASTRPPRARPTTPPGGRRRRPRCWPR